MGPKIGTMSGTLPEEDVARITLFWIFTAQGQITEHHDALGDLHKSVADDDFYQGWVERGRDETWAEHVAALGCPTVFGDLWRLVATEHFLLVALAQVIKGATQLQVQSLPQLADSELLKRLRDFGEHWEDPTGRAGQWLAAHRPGHQQDPTPFTKHGFELHGVSDDELLGWLSDLEGAVRGILASGTGWAPSPREAIWPSDRDDSWTAVLDRPSQNRPTK